MLDQVTMNRNATAYIDRYTAILFIVVLGYNSLHPPTPALVSGQSFMTSPDNQHSDKHYTKVLHYFVYTFLCLVANIFAIPIHSTKAFL